jgi:hypothetical protein
MLSLKLKNPKPTLFLQQDGIKKSKSTTFPFSPLYISELFDMASPSGYTWGRTVEGKKRGAKKSQKILVFNRG